MFYDGLKRNKVLFYSLSLLASLHLFPIELAIPEPTPAPQPLKITPHLIKTEHILPKEKRRFSPPGIPPRPLRKVKMDRILSHFKRGYQTWERKHLVDFIFEESAHYDFDPELILALISTESSFNQSAVSSQGAIGLMQIIPSTGKAIAEARKIDWYGEKDPLLDPFVNIRLGIHYLHSLNERFHDIRIALTAYNHGPTKIRRHIRQGIKIPNKYSQKVMGTYKSYLNLKTKVLDITSPISQL